MTRTSQREDIFYLPHPPTAGIGPLQTIPHRARRARLVEGIAVGSGVGVGGVTCQIEPYITTPFLSEKELKRPILFKSYRATLSLLVTKTATI